jgi:hypothetical protein
MQLTSRVGKGVEKATGNTPDDVKLVKQLLNDVHRKRGLPLLDSSSKSRSLSADCSREVIAR